MNFTISIKVTNLPEGTGNVKVAFIGGSLAAGTAPIVTHRGKGPIVLKTPRLRVILRKHVQSSSLGD